MVANHTASYDDYSCPNPKDQVYRLFVGRIDDRFVYIFDIVATSYRTRLSHQQARQHLQRKLIKKTTKTSETFSETINYRIILALHKSIISDVESESLILKRTKI